MALAMPHVEGVEHRYVRVNGLRVHYAEAGEGEPLVLQHGWPQHWWAWRDHIGPLAERFRVICPDLRGFGWSEAPPSGYDKPQLADDLIALLDALDLDRVKLVGHDWGAFAGFLACLDHPDRIERFVALSIVPPWRSGRPSPAILLRAWYQAVLAAPVVGPLAVRRVRFPEQLLKRARAADDWSDEELLTYREAIERPDSVAATVRLYRTFLLRELPGLALGAYDGHRLTVPTRLLIGRSDPIRSGLDDAYREKSDDMEVEVVDGAGHFLPEERPDAVRERILEFMS
ncbi:MAG TPA: alpha/beta hydrolase [Thermoleophilaceae bacterium]|jgi:pimeloyl-ACP methyl ester carboxylesterase